MTVEELTKAKRDLSLKIMKDMRDFEKTTGVNVTALYLDETNMGFVSTKEIIVRINI